MDDDLQAAIFTSGTAALSFAYRHSHGDYPPNMLHSMQAAARQGGKPQPIRTALDAAVTAGWIRQVIEGGNGFAGLPEPYRSVMLAKFAVDSRLNLTAKLEVLDHVVSLALGTGLHRHRMVDLCVQRYFGGTVMGSDGVRRPIRQHQVADWCDVSQQTVSATYVRIKGWLEARERVAMGLVEHELRKKGKIE
jgi:hypothetical protein